MTISLELYVDLLATDQSTLLDLATTQNTFTHPSHLPPAQLDKFLNRLSTLVCISLPPGHGSNVSHLSASEWSKKILGWRIATGIVAMDKEGYVLSGGWGKTWLLNLLAGLNNNLIPISHTTHVVNLLKVLQTQATLSPSYHRTTALPHLLKTTQAFVHLLTTHLNSETQTQTLHPNLIIGLLHSIPPLIQLSATQHRPLLPHLIPILHTLILSPSSSLSALAQKQIQRQASNVLATLHTCAGKVTAPQTFKGDLNGILTELTSILGWLESSIWKGPPTGAGGGKFGPITSRLLVSPIEAGEGEAKVLGDPAVDLGIKIKRIGEVLEGYGEVVLGLLRFQTGRPVHLPLGTVVALGLRMLGLGGEMEMQETLDGETKARSEQVLRNVWGLGMRLIGGLVLASENHLVPHVGMILEKSVWLLESLTSGEHATRVALLKFHTLLLSRIQLDPSSPSFHTRLLKSSIGFVTMVMESKTPVLNPNAEVGENAGGKKGKKRARGVGEEVVVAGMEGRVGRGLSRLEGEVVLAALKLCKVLHRHPSLSPHLLALSIRTHLALSHTLSVKTPISISQDPSLASRMNEEVMRNLEDSMLIENNGVRGGWVGLIAGQEKLGQSSVLPLILHPSAPPLSRPLPPMSSLAFYGVDHEQEEALRKEIGIRTMEEAEQAARDFEGLIETAKDEAEAARTKKKVAMEDETRMAAVAAATAPAVASAASIFGGSTSKVTPVQVPVISNASEPALPISVPSTELPAGSSSTVAMNETSSTRPIELDENPASTHQPSQVGVKDNAMAASAALTEPFSSVTTDLPARPVANTNSSAAGRSKGVPLAERKEGVRYDSEGEEMPEIDLDSDSEDEDME